MSDCMVYIIIYYIINLYQYLYYAYFDSTVVILIGDKTLATIAKWPVNVNATCKVKPLLWSFMPSFTMQPAIQVSMWPVNLSSHC